MSFVLRTSIVALLAALTPTLVRAADLQAHTDTVAKNVTQGVLALGYPQSTADNLARLTRDWNCGELRQQLAQTRSAFATGKISGTGGSESQVVIKLSEMIRRHLARVDGPKEADYFYLSTIVADKKANCLGFCQVYCILGNALGLGVQVINVPEPIGGPLPADQSHIACLVTLSDGRSMIADIILQHLSAPFKFQEAFAADGNFWKLTPKGESLHTHPRIQLLGKNGLAACIYHNLSSRYRAVGDLKQALYCSNKAIELCPTLAQAYSDRASLYGDLEKVPQGIADCNKALEINPTLAEAYCNRGILQGKSGKSEAALADLTRAIELHADYWRAYRNRATAYVTAGQTANALADFTKALELHPQDAQEYYNRGVFYAQQERYPEAVADITRAIELDPQDANNYFLRGQFYASQGKESEAKKDLQKALAMDPKSKEQVRKVSDQFKLGL